ncbi:putative Cyclase [Seiridium unicorne]|uniref:Cyclase n=1 Tax=Seiridium unicorne TaxID=138068 RepID=A0ABR2VEG8_9PEZI
MSQYMSSSLVDLSHPLDSNVTVYPGDPAFHCRQACTVSDSDWAVSELTFSSHVGTHIDAPSHRIEGAQTVDAFPLEGLARLPALIIDVSDKAVAGGSISLLDIMPYESQVQKGMAVLFRTGWDKYWGADQSEKYFQHPHVEHWVAERLMALGVAVLGVDTMSPDPVVEGAASFQVHDVVLGSGGIIAENLTNLKALLDAQKRAGRHGRIMVSLAPLKLRGCDGSPVRAFGWIESVVFAI